MQRQRNERTYSRYPSIVHPRAIGYRYALLTARTNEGSQRSGVHLHWHGYTCTGVHVVKNGDIAERGALLAMCTIVKRTIKETPRYQN